MSDLDKMFTIDNGETLLGAAHVEDSKEVEERPQDAAARKISEAEDADRTSLHERREKAGVSEDTPEAELLEEMFPTDDSHSIHGEKHPEGPYIIQLKGHRRAAVIKNRHTGQTMHSIAVDNVVDAITEAYFDCQMADLRGVKATGKDFSDGRFSMSTWDGSKLDGTIFNNADMRDSQLTRCSLRDVSFVGVDLRGVRLDGSDISGADFTGAKIAGEFGEPTWDRDKPPRGLHNATIYSKEKPYGAFQKDEPFTGRVVNED